MSDLRRLLRLVLPHWPWLAAAALFGVVAIGANVALMGLSAYLISKAAIASSVAELALAVTGVRVLAVSRATFRYLERYTTHRVMFRILATLRVWFYRAIEPLAPARLVHRRSGDLLARSVSDVDALEDFYIKVLMPPLVAAVVVASVCIVYGLFDVAIGLVLALFLVVTGVVLPLVSRRLSAMQTASMARMRGDVGAMLADQVQGLPDLVALDAASDHRARLLARARELDQARQRTGAIEGVSNALGGLFASLAGLTVLVLAIPLVSAGEVEGVFLAALPLAAIAAFEAVQPLSRSLQSLDASRASTRRLFELIDARPAVLDPVEPSAAPATHEIDIRGLSFRYEEAEPWVLQDLDLQVSQGERVAIVGPSGCGKSTLVSLLLRFWNYELGEIRVGGRDLRELGADDARAMFSVVPQDVHLFNASIEDNLAVAAPAADGEAMVHACRIAQLHDFIASLPRGYDTVVGENGLLLSGGERRRLAIARAVLRDAPIVILDEVTADLDSTTEAALWRSLEPWLAGRTVLVISHRPTITTQVDRVVRVDL
ncbi:MAG TPA: thiol reductant ABC exporter subunit CydC [Anaerolineae bacterium]|nr:thiol reductant ABC exporter subunit CydC [Anaerolineae bacterium]